jgi:hypothetical protein
VFLVVKNNFKFMNSCLKVILVSFIFGIAHALITKEETNTLMNEKANFAITPKPDNDPRFRAMATHYLTFPVIRSDF